MNTGSKSSKIDVRFSPEEKQYLSSMAKRANISAGELVRRLTSGARLPVYRSHEAIKQLSMVSADIARLGNLFKLSVNRLDKALDDERTDAKVLKELINNLENDRTEIMSSNNILQSKIREL